jgi:hypothetical protein
MVKAQREPKFIDGAFGLLLWLGGIKDLKAALSRPPFPFCLCHHLSHDLPLQIFHEKTHSFPTLILHNLDLKLFPSMVCCLSP